MHVREGREISVKIRIAQGFHSVKYLEEFLERGSYSIAVLAKIVDEHVLLSEQARIFSIHTEYEAYAEDVKRSNLNYSY